jgi:hypothetical protein
MRSIAAVAPLQMLGRAIDASLTCDIQDVAVCGARPGRGGAGHDDHASADVLGAGGIHLDLMHAPVHPVDQQPDPLAHIVAAKPLDPPMRRSEPLHRIPARLRLLTGPRRASGQRLVHLKTLPPTRSSGATMNSGVRSQF